jgi:hypothetical protein
MSAARGSGSMKSYTHSFDWVLPFSGCTEYVPELNKLWFGISSREHGSGVSEGRAGPGARRASPLAAATEDDDP